MNYQEEYDWLVNAIDTTQATIATNPKDKLHLIAELMELQKELAELRKRKQSIISRWFTPPIEIERRFI